MKYLSIATTVILTLLFTTNHVIAQETTDQFEVQVDGLGCPFCAYGLEKKFKEFKQISDVKIEMETGIMTFGYPTEEMLTLTQVEDQVDEAGYTAVHVKVHRADGSEEESKAYTVGEVDEASVIEATFFVAGNCGMCKARIEKTAKSIAGVTDAEWDKKYQELNVKFDKTQITQADLEIAMADAGHDTNTAKANDEVYNDLPGCCQYDRSN